MDKMRDQCIIHLNMVRAKLLARTAMLDSNMDRKEWMRDDFDRFTRAKDHVVAAISYLEQSHFGEDEIQLELPFE